MNTAVDSADLLRDYAATGAEAPFAELVRRHLDLVHSAALRRCGGDAALAAEVAQTVFLDLSRRARSPRRAEAEAVLSAASLAGWLYRHTTFVAATTVRGESRRRFREETASQLQAMTETTDWSRVAPVLEDAMAELPDRDREALVLRFLEKESFACVGVKLGASEDAARMRVERALERLREQLARRGVTSTAAALAVSLPAFGVAPAPAGLAATITTAAVAVPVAGGVLSALALKPVAAGVSTVLAAALLTVGYFALDLRARLATAGQERQALSGELTRLQAERDDARLSAVSLDELARLRAEHAELLRLRGEVGRLRRELAVGAATLAGATNSALAEVPTNSPPVQVLVEGRFIELADATLKSLGLTVPLNGSEVLSEAQGSALVRRLEAQSGVDILTAPRVTTLSGREAEISVAGSTAPGDQPSGETVGLTLNVIPVAPPDSRQVDLEMTVGYVKPLEPDPPAGGPPQRLDGAFGFMQSAHALVLDGQSVLLRQPAQPRSDAPAAGPRTLLVLVTPTLMDPAGRRLFPSEGTNAPAVESAASLPADAGETSPAP